MRQLGWLDEWLQVTAHARKPAVVFTSLFPYQNEILFAPPPASAWPPPSSLLRTPSPVFLSKIRWSAARFVPLSLLESILAGQPILGEQWTLDADSGPYGAEGYVRQAIAPLPQFAGNYAVLGSWIAAGKPCGLSVREDASPITKNTSRFVPHAIIG